MLWQVWDVGTGQVIRHLKGFGMKVNALLFAQDSTLIIGGSDDRSVRANTRSIHNRTTCDLSCVAGAGMGSQIA
jgi:WD40 repeat protein